MCGGFPLPPKGRYDDRQQNLASVNLLETVRRPPETGVSQGHCGWNMTRRTELLAKVRTGAVIIAAVLPVCGEARAQSPSGGGPLSFFDNIFTGSQTAPSAQRPGAPAQAQGATAPSNAPLPWSGEDGGSGHPLMNASAIRE